MSRTKQPPLAWQNIARGIYRPEPARGVPLAAQAVILSVVLVGFCLLVAAIGNAIGVGR